MLDFLFHTFHRYPSLFMTKILLKIQNFNLSVKEFLNISPLMDTVFVSFNFNHGKLLYVTLAHIKRLPMETEMTYIIPYTSNPCMCFLLYYC